MEPSGPIETPVPAPREVCQRWRVIYRRSSGAPALPQREQLAAWQAALLVSGLPLAGADLPDPRPRLVFAAPLAVGIEAEREMVDLFLVERRSVADVRLRLAGSLPAGHELVAVHDVWLGEPPLSGRVVAADYRVEIGGGAGAPIDRDVLAAAGAAMLAAPTLPRTRDKGGRPVAYDLRPLLADVTVVPADPAGRGAAGGPTVLRIRTRFDPALGVGRPEEVVAALAELAGVPLQVGSVVRERLLLAGEA